MQHTTQAAPRKRERGARRILLISQVFSSSQRKRTKKTKKGLRGHSSQLEIYLQKYSTVLGSTKRRRRKHMEVCNQKGTERQREARPHCWEASAMLHLASPSAKTRLYFIFFLIKTITIVFLN